MEKETKVLLIDDESDFTQPMAFWFGSKGYYVIVASDGESGIKLIKEKAPDVVFLDLNMPGMDGLQTLQKIREFNKNIPVIIISAYTEQLKINEVSEYGISGVFYKGADFNQGLSLLESTVRRHKNLQK